MVHLHPVPLGLTLGDFSSFLPIPLPVLATIGFRNDAQKKFGGSCCKLLFCMRERVQARYNKWFRFGPGSVCAHRFGDR